MYLPDAFAENDPQRVAALVQQYPFATLISVGQDGPMANHLPLLAEAGPSGTLADGRLIGHLARANPHSQLLPTAPALALFHGPHAYVSPRWYASPGVPTWNYAVVHIEGQASLMESPEATLAALVGLTAQFEANTEEPWTLATTEDRIAGLTHAIVAFEITITSVRAKFKLSQNRPEADRTRVREALLQDEAALAHWM